MNTKNTNYLVGYRYLHTIDNIINLILKMKYKLDVVLSYDYKNQKIILVDIRILYVLIN